MSRHTSLDGCHHTKQLSLHIHSPLAMSRYTSNVWQSLVLSSAVSPIKPRPPTTAPGGDGEERWASVCFQMIQLLVITVIIVDTPSRSEYLYQILHTNTTQLTRLLVQLVLQLLQGRVG